VSSRSVKQLERHLFAHTARDGESQSVSQSVSQIVTHCLSQFALSQVIAAPKTTRTDPERLQDGSTTDEAMTVSDELTS
jgi:hypothetical protein